MEIPPGLAEAGARGLASRESLNSLNSVLHLGLQSIHSVHAHKEKWPFKTSSLGVSGWSNGVNEHARVGCLGAGPVENLPEAARRLGSGPQCRRIRGRAWLGPSTLASIEAQAASIINHPRLFLVRYVPVIP